MSNRTDFAALPATPLNHFRLHFYAAVSHVFAAAARVSAAEPIAECLQALSGYDDQLRACGVPAMPATATLAWWKDVIIAWERSADPFLPVRAVRNAIGVGVDDMIVVFAAGLADEDARFGTLFERLNETHGQRGQSRPIAAVLADGRRDDGRADLRTALARLAACGLVRIVNADAPRAQQALDVPALVWDVFRGERVERPAPWLRYLPPAALPATADLILSAPNAGQLSASARLVASGQVGTVIVRGPQHNGRRTALRAIARASGFGVLDVAGRLDDDRWRQLALLATAMQAMPVVAWEAAPGERIELQRPEWFAGPIGIAIGRSGGIGGHTDDHAITLTLGMPGVEERRARWRRELGGGEADAIADHFRTPSGQIARLASLARAQAALAGRQSPAIDDVREASRLLNAQALETLATRVPSTGDWTDLAVRDDTIRELLDLELRCRQREHGLETWTGSGVRALFRGPSGSGKSLAARLLAAGLQRDLYRVDLSSIVDKYIGETEKNLDRVLSRAEELDVVLLFDEGDALLTQRTGVGSANDRYANLETNFLLQRLEAFEGILVVTTNAGERIDAAFERRMDVVVEFHPAQAAERWALWHLHLPTPHAVPPDFLDELASRCVLSGGQIKNAVQHAALQAMPRGTIDAAMLDAAVRREYRKAGAVCPLRSVVTA